MDNSKITKKKAKPVLKPGIAQQAEELLKQNQISYYKELRKVYLKT